MCDKKIGGSYSCRNCGDIHTFGIACDIETLPLQKVQVAFEDIEDFFAGLSMSVETRKIFEESFKKLRTLLVVPEEKIYNKKSLMGIDELEETKDKTVRLNPTSEVLEKASAIISRVCDFAVNNVYVTKLQEEPMMTIISSLKNEVLKK